MVAAYQASVSYSIKVGLSPGWNCICLLPDLILYSFIYESFVNLYFPPKPNDSPETDSPSELVLQLCPLDLSAEVYL